MLTPFCAFAQAARTAPVPSNVPERAPDKFPIYAIDVSGVTKLAPGEIENIIYRFTGPDRSNIDVEAARKAIQDAYTVKGYESVLVESPLQTREMFNAGVIAIAVNESPVANVNVTGSKYHSERVLRSQLPSIAQGQPLDFKALQKQFSNADRFPDRKVEFNPKPGTVPGTIDVDLVVKDEFPLHSTMELNNDNSSATSRLRLSGSTRYTDVFKLGHTLSANFIFAPQRKSDSSVVAASYVAPLLDSPWTLSISGYRSNSDIAALGGTNVLGNGYQVGVRAAYRLPVKTGSQSIGFALDFKNFNQDVLVGGVSVGRTPIRYIPLTVDYSAFGGDSESSFAKKFGTSTFGVTAGATLGLRAIKRQLCIDTSVGQSKVVDRSQCNSSLPNRILSDQFTNSAVSSSENFVHFNLGFNYSLATPSDWVFASSWNVQIADVHLVTNEQFSAGGRSTVRGYFESEAVGDQGFVSTFELAGPSLATLLGKSVDELRAYAFVDSAYIRSLSVLPGVNSTTRLLGVGGGARLRLFDHISGEVIVGVPLNAGPASKKGEPRMVFVVRGEL
ncbi:ShlB/FhaC/HecB family hemolysin secretion/activation protein [Sphingomonas sp.]|uniref:ShlB/FhaC/HecB family hemolysin secretion/activation protein n=1 Tax=Sphingomonas sp. TaxID=28214 RepID=UPI0025D3D97A|nr:ShlB/FhaC/HecB family hemolysin secretion/activation protein [Sphingomonas sp.]